MGTPPLSESEADLYLVDAIRAGDSGAWQQVIDRYQGRLVSFARRMLAQRSDAEDLVQETFLGLLRSLPNYDRNRSLETYLFAILRHKLADHLQRMQKGQRQSLDQLELDDAPAAWVDADTPSGRLLAAEGLRKQRAAVATALREYVEHCRQQQRFQELIVVEMLVVLGLRNKEVAADLGLTETAVAGVKFRVLEQWRKLAQSAAVDFQDADLARDSSVGRIWREESISCLKRSTLGRYLLGVLDPEWQEYVEFHVEKADCDRCQANLDDLRSEDERDAGTETRFRERCFTSSVGFLSRPG